MKKPTTPRLTFSEFIENCPYCGQKAAEARDCWSVSIRKVTTCFHYKCMIRRNHEILQHKAN